MDVDGLSSMTTSTSSEGGQLGGGSDSYESTWLSINGSEHTVVAELPSPPGVSGNGVWVCGESGPAGVSATGELEEGC